MRLIDADALKRCYTGSNGLDDKASYESIRKMIDAQPTAYDVDRVEEQLEDYLFEKYCVEGDSKVEKIVKGGGVNE